MVPCVSVLLRRPFRSLSLLLLCAAATLAAGCAGRFPSERIPQMKLLLLPFSQPPSMSTDPRAVKGYWMGAKTVRQNPRDGAAIVDVLNRHLADADYIHLYSPIEIKYYFADKKRLLKKAYPYLDDAEVENLINQQPQLEYAHELAADKILSGRIERDYMAENRTFGPWWATLDCEVFVQDVGTGKKEWTKQYHLHHAFASNARLHEELAQQVIKDLQREYFLPMARK